MTDKNTQQDGIDGQALVEEYRAYRRIGAILVIVAFIILMLGMAISAWLNPVTLDDIDLTSETAITEQYQQADDGLATSIDDE